MVHRITDVSITQFSQDWLKVSPLKSNSQSGEPGPSKLPVKDDSATEDSDEEQTRAGVKPIVHSTSPVPGEKEVGSDAHDTRKKPPLQKAKAIASSDDDSSPKRPVKKAKQKPATSSDDDSDSEPKRRGGSANASKGARQPIKRGGRRF